MKMRLAECPPGHFIFEFGGSKCLGFKSEYHYKTPDGLFWPEAYVAASGEAFWGDAKTQEARASLVVEPVDFPDIALFTPIPDDELAEIGDYTPVTSPAA